MSLEEQKSRYSIDYLAVNSGVSQMERLPDDFLEARPSQYEMVYFDRHWALFMKAETIQRYPDIKPFRMLYPVNIADEHLMRQAVERGNLPVLRVELAYYRTMVRQPEQQQLYDLMRAEIAKYGPVD